jgi:hypothetical protein
LRKDSIHSWPLSSQVVLSRLGRASGSNRQREAGGSRVIGASNKTSASYSLPVRKYGDLLSHLSTLDRQAITFSSQQISKLTEPTPVQRRAFELLGAPIPLTLK